MRSLSFVFVVLCLIAAAVSVSALSIVVISNADALVKENKHSFTYDSDRLAGPLALRAEAVAHFANGAYNVIRAEAPVTLYCAGNETHPLNNPWFRKAHLVQASADKTTMFTYAFPKGTLFYAGPAAGHTSVIQAYINRPGRLRNGKAPKLISESPIKKKLSLWYKLKNIFQRPQKKQ